LILANKEFKSKGYEIIFDSISAPLPAFQKICPPPMSKEGFIKLFNKTSYDIVFLAYHHSQKVGMSQLSSDDRAEVLGYLKAKTKTLCWLDTSDSTGTCSFDVLPFVDYYFKKQLLVNRDDYYRELYGGRIWCDYYHNKYGINDDDLSLLHYKLLDKRYENKIKISWNVGLGDLFTKEKWRKIIFRRKYAPFKFTYPTTSRQFDVHYRGSTSKSLALYQRNKIIELLNKTESITMPDISKKVPYKNYVRELRNSRLLISPFGWGEICGRDFEAFMYGATLIKMDMSHLVTYPNFYISNETYIPIKWDFSNFDSTITYLMTEDGKNKALEIAKKGQDLYKEYMTTKEKREEFVGHILSQIGEK
ncbi:MAG: hypothetical protein GX638_14540, partial [Crenarchaeota archaeon]|nr:hypothetical protein [Thermoproteota archaeon]